MIATIAFGMGIDKPNVRYVINYDIPKSIEEFYQQIGRAGRDGLVSSSLLLYSSGDLQKIRFFFNENSDPEKSEKLLQGMVSFSTARSCRRQALLSYFGENYVSETSQQSDENGTKFKCCDICSATDGKGQLPLVDLTIPVQKLLCCIIRTKERFGTTYVIDVLLGSRNKRIMENGHNMISTWGIGTELSKDDWLELVDLLIAKNYLLKAGEYNILTITAEGKALLATREKVLLPFIISEKNSRNSGKTVYSIDSESNSYMYPKPGNNDIHLTRKKSGALIVAERPDAEDATGEKIIEELKAWRKRKAEDLNVPPYIIFGDKTLLDLAAKKPKSKKELLNVYGIGEAKAEEFGKSIIRIITDIK